MSAARELLDRFAEIGATVRPAAGDHLIVRAGANPVPAELVQRLRQAKAEVLAALAPVGHWPETLDRGGSELGGYRLHPEAERLAFCDMTLRWHRRHGIRPDLGRCAGCGDELPDFAGLVVDRDGVRVHFDAARRDDCIIAFGQKWRGAAVAALKALGLDPPVGFELL
jgi:hypothetical protein